MKSKLISQLFFIFLLSTTLISSGCSSSSSGDDDDDAAAGAALGYPSGLVIASPTTSGAPVDSALVYGGGGAAFATFDNTDTYADKVAAIDAILAADTDEDCQVVLPNFAGGPPASCYGPALDYCDHTDFTGAEDTGCTDADAEGEFNDTDGDGQLPTGDLGIWTSTEDGTEACAAAKINSLIAGAADNTDYVQLTAASMICLMKRAGTSLPSSDGDSVDLTTDLNTAIQVNNPDVTVTTATIENLADVTDNDADETSRDAYQYIIVTTDESGAETITSTTYMNHMPTATDNSTFKGRLWVEIEGAAGAGDKNGFSVTYEKASGTSLKYRMLSANYQMASDSTVIFDSDGNIDVGGDWTGNFSMAIINMDPSTGIGNFSYGWSAGTGTGGDPEDARIFNGYTTTTGGCGFFGYGDGFDNSGDGTLSDNVIDGFICNWAGPNNSHDMTGATASMAQKQCMTLDTTTGIFGVDATKENITYAPEVDCDGDAGFLVKLESDSTFSAAPTTANLVDLTTDTDYDSYTAPTAPDLPGGL